MDEQRLHISEAATPAAWNLSFQRVQYFFYKKTGILTHTFFSKQKRHMKESVRKFFFFFSPSSLSLRPPPQALLSILCSLIRMRETCLFVRVSFSLSLFLAMGCCDLPIQLQALIGDKGGKGKTLLKLYRKYFIPKDHLPVDKCSFLLLQLYTYISICVKGKLIIQCRYNCEEM